MNLIPIYQVDAFATHTFEGNPAAVCIMEDQYADHILQSIAAENNLAETAFIWNVASHFSIRWFTPTKEVDLCGHATLASAHVLFKSNLVSSDTVRFDSKSGPLSVTRENDGRLILDFPKDEFNHIECPNEIIKAINSAISHCVKGKSDYLVQIDSEDALKNIKPDFSLIKKLNARGLIVTAPGHEVDFVSRCFYPQYGIDEDPVTGSAHTTLTPYWAERLNKTDFIAKQISSRGGTLYCSLKNDRVLIGGYAQLYLEGKIYI